ncbi:MAG: Rrf2 family transcriptional regulator [Verrucomicrobiota bacterium]
MRSDFAISLHIMGFLTASNGTPLSSQVLAETYGTNPVVIRRLLSKLNFANLVTTQRGVGGGSILARDPSAINLRDIYLAVTEKPGFLPRYPVREHGPSSVIGAYINTLLESVEEDALIRLSEINICEMDEKVRPAICKLLEGRNFD